VHKNYFGGVIVEFLSKALNWYSALPSAVMIMIGILLIGLILARLNPLKALKSSIYVAAGIVGLNALVGMFAGAIIPPLTQVIQSTGLKLDIVDLGVGSAQSFVIFPLSFYAILLVVGLAVNVMMIFLKLTDTFDVDIFNYYVWALSSAFVYALTQSIPLAVAAFVITEIVVLKLADITAPAIGKVYGLEGVSVPHGNAVVYAPVGMLVNWVIEKIPVLNKIDWSPEEIERRFGGFVEPSTLGFVMGIVLGAFAKCPLGTSVLLGITTAAFMIIFPKVLNILIEGIMPVADGMREFTEKKLKRKLYIGLDAAILVGMPDVMAVGILLVPAIILLAFILPGNHVLPLADLAIAAPFLVSCCMPYCKKNIFRGFISGIIIFTLTLYICTDTASLYTEAAALNGHPFESLSTSLGIASTPVSWIIAKIVELFI
jgi:PTS system galactitol-specific IIC component